MTVFDRLGVAGAVILKDSKKTAISKIMVVLKQFHSSFGTLFGSFIGKLGETRSSGSSLKEIGVTLGVNNFFSSLVKIVLSTKKGQSLRIILG